MTPAIDTLKKLKLPFSVHSYDHEPGTQGYGLEAADKLGLSPNVVFKTLLVTDGAKQFATVVVPVAGMLNLKRAAKVLGWKKAAMASAEDAQRITGYVLGGISPLGQKKRLPTVVDDRAFQQASIHISAGRRGLEIEVSARTLVQALEAKQGDVAEL
ncbi:Cys-tRNA(Pro) deacylase [Salinispirillum marinum]|uniref:Cys-tRNA(Pro)/Cys-tRNA(Cys) deacylase n=2 Tax=Saccharospirillaceae TaxID=255527 RepID=A0ABV8B909_9GAMM